MEIIDASNCVLGRLAAYVAKKALEGEKLIILNCKKIILLGNKKNIIEEYRKKLRRGKGRQKGPYFTRKPFALMKRTIRGMLPKKSRGKEALKRILCYDEIPEEYEKKEKKEVKSVKNLENINFLTLNDLTSALKSRK